MTLAGVLAAFAAGAFFLWLARRPPDIGRRPTRRQRLLARALQLVYLFSGLTLLARGAFALTGLN